MGARSDRSVALWLGTPLLFGIVFSWTRIALETNDVPADADFVAARVSLEAATFEPGLDALAILPPWSLRPLEALGSMEPIGSDALSTQILERYRRLFVLVEPDPGPEAGQIVKRLGAPTQASEHGRVALWRFDLPAPSVTFDLRERLSDARVRLTGAAAEVPCERAAGGRAFQCQGRPSWQRVSREWLVVTENADDAVWAHPPPRGERLEIEWVDVPIGASMVVRAGHTREGADSAHAPVQLHVDIDGERVATLVRSPAFDFRTDVIDTRAHAGKRARLALVIESTNEASNHFAWDAALRSTP